MNDHYEKWNQLAPLGLLLIGGGFSIASYAGIRKGKGKGWFFIGTLGLIMMNAGIAIFGESVKARTLYEMKLEALQRSSSV